MRGGLRISVGGCSSGAGGLLSKTSPFRAAYSANSRTRSRGAHASSANSGSRSHVCCAAIGTGGGILQPGQVPREQAGTIASDAPARPGRPRWPVPPRPDAARVPRESGRRGGRAARASTAALSFQGRPHSRSGDRAGRLPRPARSPRPWACPCAGRHRTTAATRPALAGKGSGNRPTAWRPQCAGEESPVPTRALGCSSGDRAPAARRTRRRTAHRRALAGGVAGRQAGTSAPRGPERTGRRLPGHFASLPSGINSRHPRAWRSSNRRSFSELSPAKVTRSKRDDAHTASSSGALAPACCCLTLASLEVTTAARSASPR